MRTAREALVGVIRTEGAGTRPSWPLPARSHRVVRESRHGRPTVDAAAAAEVHLRRWLLLEPARARRVVDALARPLWRTQVVAAVEGAELVREKVLRTGLDPVAEHLRLLDDPDPPASLRVRTSTERTS